MDTIISQFAHIFIHYYSNKASSTCKLFISEPNKNQEAQMGRIFGILEINTPSRENSLILTQIISDLEEIYYSQIDNNLGIEKALENTLEQINQRFSQLLKEKKFYLVGNLNEITIREKINLVVGVLYESNLFISYLNNIGLYLIHKTKQDYKLIDIKKISSEEKDAQTQDKSAKLFSNLIAGEVRPGDYLFLCNINLLDYISLERIQKTITSLPIHKAAEYFKNSLLQFEGQNFAAIMIKNSLLETEPKTSPSSLISITELNSTESSTERLLEPSFWSGFKIIPNFFNNLLGKTEAKKNISSDPASLPQTSKKLTGQPKFSKFLYVIALPFKKLFKWLGNKMPSLKDRLNNLKVWLRLKIAYLGNNLKKIPNLSKILLFVATFLVILFVYSTSYFKQQQVRDEHSQEFDKIAAQIDEQRNLAESDLIYGNEDKARTEIAEAQKLLTSLIIESQKQKDQQAELNKNIEVVVAKIRKITTIEDPVLIADLGAQQESNINVSSLIYQNNQLFAFESLNNFAYQINLDTREIKKSDSNLSDIGQIVKAKNIDNKILLYHDKNGFVQFQDGKYTPFAVSLSATSKLIDFADYSGKLYIVDSNSNQIYRLPKTDTGYGPGTAWLKSSSDLKNIVSLGIDSNIWLLDKTGPILKFNKGSLQNFTPKNLEPSLEAPSQILTNDETNYLYILEPKNKRIVVLDKAGNLITQYYSQSFENLKGIEISEQEKKMFVINDNKIYFFNLTHIK
ncbi:MAG: hypothetical protein WC460_01845 [Patescibacteria group bacterium]